ncbi:reverse transcriptase domain-containing protein [Paracoccus sp. AS002]|uniref:reverse transcriptase domain-containing protein n=1 Tax=Paracoccus sp. AS002 TaxID=3019545 RepID=UPI0023E7C48D|nr:reverse transcriptase domain-containing protein [Paracoccus sp. AS002]MDF3907263.1 reverse transcriptase domain-containing protein [Paracoccus sp. AS002]
MNTPRTPCPVQPVATVRTKPSAPVQPVATQHDARWPRDQGKAHDIFARRKARIADLFAAGRRTMPDVRAFLNDRQVRLSATLRALGGDPSRQQAHDLLDGVNAWAEACSPVRWYAKQKRTGGSRPICILPPDLKAVHYMIAAVVGAQLPPSAALYGIPGASRDDAARDLKKLQNSGLRHLAKADIKDCFQSIDPDALYQLPLPKEVIRQTLDHRCMTFTESSERKMKGASANSGHSRVSCVPRNPSGPQGLLQGSPASSIILAWLLGGIPQGDDVAVLLCFDNIAVAGRTADDTRAMMDKLADFFRRCPAGPLELRDIEYRSGDAEPLDFLGYSFDPAEAAPVASQYSLDKLERSLRETEEEYQAQRPILPTGIWHVLRDARNGFSAAAEDDPNLIRYIESTADGLRPDTPAWVFHLHRNIFAPRGTPEGEAIHAILEAHPRPHTKPKGK